MLDDARSPVKSTWPDDRPFTGAGFTRVDTSISCVLTRFRLRSAWSLIPFYCAYLRVRKKSREIRGLLKAIFLLENLHTCYTLSMWTNDEAIVEFSTRVYEHVHAANCAFGPTYNRDLKRSEIWSAQFRLWAVSSCNFNWEGLNMRELSACEPEKREFVNRVEHIVEEQTDGR